VREVAREWEVGENQGQSVPDLAAVAAHKVARECKVAELRDADNRPVLSSVRSPSGK